MTDESAEPLLSRTRQTPSGRHAQRRCQRQSTKELELGSTDQRLRQSLELADKVGKTSRQRCARC